MLQLAQDVRKVLKFLECPFLPTNFIKEISFLCDLDVEAQYQLKDTKTFGGFDSFDNSCNPTMHHF
jgi:hypothetical protein